MKDLKRGDRVHQLFNLASDGKYVGIVLQRRSVPHVTNDQYEVYWSNGRRVWVWSDHLTKIEDIEND
jgi:hypothetical protein